MSGTLRVNATLLVATAAARTLRTRVVLLVQLAVPVIHRDATSLDEHLDDLRADVERIAGREEYVRHLAGLDRADLRCGTEDFGRPDRQCLHRCILRQSVCNRE